MFVVILSDTNAEYGPAITDVFGPYDTEREAQDAAEAYFKVMDERHEMSSVFSYDIKPVRTAEKSMNAHSSFIWMFQRLDKWWREKDNDRAWP